MRSSIYDYNENLISELSYKYIIDKYALNNDNLNQAIYYAVSSMDAHVNSIINSAGSQLNILLGDYYSFEYYNLVQNNLRLVANISLSMSKNYEYLQRDILGVEEVYHIIFSLYEVLINEYNIQLTEKDIECIIASYEKYFLNKLSQVVSFNFDKNNLLESARERYVK